MSMQRLVLLSLMMSAIVVWSCGSSGGDNDAGDMIDRDSDGIDDAEDDMVDLDSDGIHDPDDPMVDLDSDGVHDNPPSTDDICGEGDVTFGMSIPTVILLIDQSGTMEESFGGTTRWNAVYETLFDPDNGVVSNLESQVRFGMQLYTSTDEMAENGECPMLTGVAPDMNNYAAMNTVFRDNDPVEDTPTGASIDEVVTLLQADTAEGRKIIVLATDGLPDSCDIPDPDYNDPDRVEANQTEAEAIAAAQNAFSNDIPLFVISVGDDVGASHLSEMANAGQGYALDDPDGAEYYMGLDPESLQVAFQDIISGVRNCELALEGEVDESMADQCSVQVDGQSLIFNDPDGWQLNNASEIEVLGDTCDAILDGSITNLSVQCPCGAYTVVV